jgi:transcriptional regulator with XRE-family HTH domain
VAVSRFAKFTYRSKFDGQDHERREQLGKLLRRARRQAHLTQASVARTLGYKQQADISRIETTKRSLDPIELENLARLYGKSLNDFATWREDQPSTEALRERARSHHTALAFQRRYYKGPKDNAQSG